jgi:hypothetical protein
MMPMADNDDTDRLVGLLSHIHVCEEEVHGPDGEVVLYVATTGWVWDDDFGAPIWARGLRRDRSTRPYVRR